jgi:2-dehydropantoate 2-reductase
MRIAIMAAGAVGAYYGARLAAAGNDVSFIARGVHFAAIRQHGLKIESVHGDLHLYNPNVTDEPKTIGTVDIVMFAVKLWDTEQAAKAALPLIGPNTRLITFQNGIDNVERLAPIIGAEKTVGGIAYIASNMAAPGVIKHTSQFHHVRVGHADKHSDPQLDAFVEVGKGAKLDFAISENIERELWEEVHLSHLDHRRNRGFKILGRPDLFRFSDSCVLS